MQTKTSYQNDELILMFEDYLVEPFIETKDWVRSHWGRLVVENTLVDLVADETYDFPNHEYEPFLWKGNLLWLETSN